MAREQGTTDHGTTDKASGVVGELIAAHDFNLRERLILDLIRLQSFGVGRTEAYIPQLRYFARATRISSGNVSSLLAGLKRKRVIEETQQGFYGIILPADNWKVSLRTEAIEVIRQLSLLEAPPHLGSALRQTFIEQCHAALPTRTHATGPTEPAPKKVGVPESGTPTLFHENSRIGNHARSPHKQGLSPPVPESGTLPHVHGHGTEHVRLSMDHVIRLTWKAALEKDYDVGALARMTGAAILEELLRYAPNIKERYLERWVRRIEENHRLVWIIAMELRDKTGVSNPAGWANGAYMKQQVRLK